MQKIIGDWLLDWQTLIGGGLALLGAWLTVRALRIQARTDEDRKARAARVMLPSALNLLVDYAIASVRWLEGIRKNATLSEAGAYKTANMTLTHPKTPLDLIKALRDCVEFLPLAHARHVGEILSKIQVQNTWIASLDDYLVNYSLYEIKRFGLTKEIDDASVKSVKLIALANSLFPFARFETDDVPETPGMKEEESAFKQCHLNTVKNVTVWNALTTPYIDDAQNGGVRAQGYGRSLDPDDVDLAGA